MPKYGAFVISLDFELLWGVEDYVSSNPAYTENIVGEYRAVPAILQLFEEFGVAATWATVGLIFADSAIEAEAHRPEVVPAYDNQELSPYVAKTVTNRENASLRFAPELIEQIKRTPGQEVATHTFSHYYCLEPGQTVEAFAADIDSAIAIAGRKAISFKSIVFPRNQHNRAYDNILVERGIACYRGNQMSRMYQFDSKTQSNKYYRLLRLIDTYVNISGFNTKEWSKIDGKEIVDIPASIFLRPVSRATGLMANLQFRRIAKSMEDAAKNNKVFHLWWHPHNFGVNLDENLAFLRRVLEHFCRLREDLGMRSMTMAEAADAVRGAGKDIAV